MFNGEITSKSDELWTECTTENFVEIQPQSGCQISCFAFPSADSKCCTKEGSKDSGVSKSLNCPHF